MFTWLKKVINAPLVTTATGLNIKVIKMPLNGLSPLVNYYENKGGGDVPVVLVAIYNTEQLASEIAKYLKNNTSNSSNGDNDGKTTPKPT